MPSKRKKNKRRMRRVQAQRRLLEEQHAACPPVKASPALVVGAPGTVSKKTAKKPKPAPPKVPEVVAKVPEVVAKVPEVVAKVPEVVAKVPEVVAKVPEVVAKVPEAVPIAVPIVEAPKVIPKVEPPKEEPVVEPVKIEVPAEPEPEPEVVVLEQTPVEVEIPEVPAPVITVEPVIVEEPVIIEEPVITEEPVIIEEPVITEEPIVEALPVEEAKIEAAVVEAENTIILESESEIEVIQAEVPVAAPAEIQVIQEETPVFTEIKQTHGVYEPEPQVEAQVTTFDEDITITDDNVEEPITEQITESLVCNEKTEVIEVVTVAVTEAEADIEEEGSQSDALDQESCPVEVTADETESIESELVETEVVEVISNDVTEPDVEEDIEELSSQTEECDNEEEPVKVTVDDPVSVEPVEPEPAEEVAEAEVVTHVVECVESDPVVEEEEESYSSEEEEEDCETEVLSDETPAETNQIIQDAPIPNGELPVELDALPLPPLTAAPEPVTQVEEIPVDTDDVMVDDFVVTDTSAEVIEPKTIELLPVLEKPTVAVCEIFGLGPAKMIPEPDQATEDVLTDVAAAAESLETCPMGEASLTNTSANTFVGTEWMKQEVSSLEI